ncbi:MAG: AMP-binding protein [Maritimibacter sp.]|nr:AMP-binding protein [Maritimibacter sp.]
MFYFADIWTAFDQTVARVGRDHPALIRGDVTVSFAALRALALEAAERLRAAGGAAGDRCVIWSENSVEMAAAILGAAAAGMVPVLVNAEAPQSHAIHAVTQVGATLLLTTEDKADVAADCVVLGLGSGLARGRMARGPAQTPAPRDAASIVFTSGSTGLPKGVVQSPANLMWGCHEVGRAVGLRADDRLVVAIPWAFDYGWGHLLTTFLYGVPQILPERKGGIGLCEAIARHRPTVLPSVPAVMAELVSGLTPIRDIDASSLRLVMNTGSKIPAPQFAQMLEVFPEIAISLNYGLTETYRSATLPLALARSKPAAVGAALPGAALAVLRADGTEASAGEKGEVIHRGMGVFLGYWGDGERTLAVRRPDPLAPDHLPRPAAMFTGDIGWMDDEGHLHIEGRRDRQLKSFGTRVSPDEVEGLILATGLVDEVAIVGVPHEMVGHQITAVIVPRGDEKAALRGLKISARETMSNFMRPMVWHVVERLPRNPNGKVDYPKVLAMATALAEARGRPG